VQKAYRYAVLKWDYIVQNNGFSDGLYNKHPKLKDFIAGCSYCELFQRNDCFSCPIKIDNRKSIYDCSCNDHEHPFHKWACNKSYETAKEVLNFIIKNKPTFMWCWKNYKINQKISF